MDDKEKSFLCTLHVSRGNAFASIGFQKAVMVDTPPKGAGGSMSTNYLHYVNHETVKNLHCSSYEKNQPVLLYFRHVNDGQYKVYSKSENFHFGEQLFINNDAITTSNSPAEVNLFSFKKNGTRINIHETADNQISAELVCKDGGIELRDVKKINEHKTNFTAQIVTKGGDGPIGDITIRIVEREVDWLK